MPRRNPGETHPIAVALPQLLLRTRDVAAFLGVSRSQVESWRRDGTLRVFTLPGLRAVRYSREEVERVARRWIDGDAGARSTNSGGPLNGAGAEEARCTA